MKDLREFKKQDFLHTPVEHIDITRYPVVELVEAMGKMAYSARDLARAAEIYHRMLSDPNCGVILCLAGSLVSRRIAEDVRRHGPLPNGRYCGSYRREHRRSRFLRSSRLPTLPGGSDPPYRAFMTKPSASWLSTESTTL